MSLHDARSSFLSRSLAALLGVGALAPLVAHADEAAPVAVAVGAEADVSAQALPAADLSRPLHMRDLGTTSSFGLRLEGATSDPAFAGGHMTTGLVDLGAELAVGENFKMFASFPLTHVSADSFADDFSGHGNLTLGAQIQGQTGRLHLGVGGSVSQWGDDESRFAIVADHLDEATYMSHGTVLRAFTTAKLGDDDRFVQAEASYTRYEPSQFAHGAQLPDQPYAQGAVGGGVRLGNALMLHGELGLVHVFPLVDEDGDGTNVALVDVGVRGRFTRTSPASWAAGASLLHDDHVTSLGFGLELRADLPGLGK